MKKTLCLIIVLFSLFGLQNIANAQSDGIGIGAIINAPTGLSIKGWINESQAIDGALTFHVGDDFSEVYLHSDYLFHTNSTVDVESGMLRLYYGGGLRFIWTHNSNPLIDQDHFQIGARGPIGLDYGLDSANIDIFMELAPTLNVQEDFFFGFEGGLGFRYYLD